MQGKHKHEPQMDMFKTQLKELVSKEHSLVVLSRRIDWGSIDKEFEQYYSKEGRPSVPTRTMVGLLMLKSMFNQADETVIPMWVETIFQTQSPLRSQRFGSLPETYKKRRP
jgi:transposase, IS5 family